MRVPKILLLVTPAIAQQMDPDFAQFVEAWTAKPKFSSPLVDGAPNKLSYYEDLLIYYRALAAESPRVRIVDTSVV